MAKKQTKNAKDEVAGWTLFFEYFKVIALAVVIAFFIRFFIIQAFTVPSGSMIPTFLIGDYVIVDKFSYGIRSPFNNEVWINTGKPQRGDVAIFIYPHDQSKDFVKRVIGLPGDKVELKDGLLYINDAEYPDEKAHYDPLFRNNKNYGPVIVPENNYFMMGDNRDHSSDSREWGYVDFKYFRGKARRLHFSWDSQDPNKKFYQRIRWNRIGQKIE